MHLPVHHSSALFVDVEQAFPDRIYASLGYRPALKAGRTYFIAESAIGHNTFSRALTANQTGAVSVFWGTSIPIIFKHNPFAKLLPYGDWWMYRKGQQRVVSIRTAVHAYLSRQVFHLALHG
jgi:hypothetical protein